MVIFQRRFHDSALEEEGAKRGKREGAMGKRLTPFFSTLGNRLSKKGSGKSAA